MERPDFIDAEMQELLDAMGAAIVPRSRRRVVVRTNWHVPYYSQGRYKKI